MKRSKKVKFILSGVFAAITLPMVVTSCSTNEVSKITTRALVGPNTLGEETNTFYQYSGVDNEVYINSKYDFSVKYVNISEYNCFKLARKDSKTYILTIMASNTSQKINSNTTLNLMAIEKDNNIKYIDLQIYSDNSSSIDYIDNYPLFSYSSADSGGNGTINKFEIKCKITNSLTQTTINDAIYWKKLEIHITDKSGVDHQVLDNGSSTFDQKYKMFGYSATEINDIKVFYLPASNFPSSDFDPLATLKYSFTAVYKSTTKIFEEDFLLNKEIPPLTITVAAFTPPSSQETHAGNTTFSIASVSPTSASKLAHWEIDRVRTDGSLEGLISIEDSTTSSDGTNGIFKWNAGIAQGIYQLCIIVTSRVPNNYGVCASTSVNTVLTITPHS